MAGEVLGKTYEAMTHLGLSMAGIPDRRIFWDRQPSWMSIKADFVIGGDLDRPECIILCAHSESSSDSHKKFWRNVQELFETKASRRKSLCAYNIVFDSSYKQKLLGITSSIFDGHLEIPERSYGKLLLKRGNTLATGPFKGIGADGMVVKLKKLCDPSYRDYDQDLSKALNDYASDIKKLLKGISIEFQSLWPLVRQEYQRPVKMREAKPTYVKRGIGKLILFTAPERKTIYEHIRTSRELDEIPDFAKHLNLFTETIMGFVLDDIEVRTVVEQLGTDTIEYVISRSPLDRMNLFIQPIRHISNLRLFHQFVIEHYDELITPEGMFKYLEECYDDPENLLPKNSISGSIEKVWLVEYLFALFKSWGERKQSYGYSWLTKDSGVREGVSGGYISFADFVNRKSRINNNLLIAISDGLARHLGTIGKDQIDSKLPHLIHRYLANLLEDKLLPYRSFEPVGYLVQKALNGAGIGWKMVKSHASCLSEFAGVSAGTTKVLLTKQDPPVLIKWQSAYDKGKGHKRKELAARGTSMKFKWDRENRTFSSRDYVAFILVLDGTWTKDDLEVLQRAGWDYIFYVDEMDQLIKLLKGIEVKKKFEIHVPEEKLPLAAEVNTGEFGTKNA
ncbi:MAG: hypothetical protein ACFFCW_36970 [Candidatus Hodarchaeota archaeon]